MKIGILTLPFNNNYGGYLQSYALMTVLKREGHEVELIYRRHNRIPFSKKIVPSLKNIVKVLIGRKVVSIIPNEEKTFRYQGASMMPFLDNNIMPKSKPLYSSKEFNEYVSGRYDAVIVGSDQVWRPEYGPGISDYFFCGIPDENLIRISYAASFGTDEPQFKADDLRVCRKSMRLFKGVSVRESSGIRALARLGFDLACEPQVVLDPTLLLSPDDYSQIIGDIDSSSRGKVFTYVLDSNEEKESIISQVCDQMGKEKYAIVDIQKANSSLPSIESWLAAIRDADYVITDSFHGMVFSVIFQKEFIVVPNIKRGGSRFTSFLGSIGLEDRIILGKSEITSRIFKIDYNVVNSRLYILRNQSSAFLQDCL